MNENVNGLVYNHDETITTNCGGPRATGRAFDPGSAAEASFRVDNGAVALRIDRAGASRVNGRGFGLARLNPRDPHAARSFRARAYRVSTMRGTVVGQTRRHHVEETCRRDVRKRERKYVNYETKSYT